MGASACIISRSLGIYCHEPESYCKCHCETGMAFTVRHCLMAAKSQYKQRPPHSQKIIVLSYRSKCKPNHNKTHLMTCEIRKCSDQAAHLHTLIRTFTFQMCHSGITHIYYYLYGFRTGIFKLKTK